MTYKIEKEKLLDNWAVNKKELSNSWISNTKALRSRVFIKGEVILVNFGENLGSEQNSDSKNFRPAIVLSKDRVNKGILIVAPLTTKRLDKVFEFQILLEKQNYPFLRNNSKVLLDQIRTISSVRVQHKIGVITLDDHNQIDLALTQLFNLEYLLK